MLVPAYGLLATLRLIPLAESKSRPVRRLGTPPARDMGIDFGEELDTTVSHRGHASSQQYSPPSILPCMSIDLIVRIPAMDRQRKARSTGKGAFTALKVRIAHGRYLWSVLAYKERYLRREKGTAGFVLTGGTGALWSSWKDFHIKTGCDTPWPLLRLRCLESCLGRRTSSLICHLLGECEN